MTVATTTNKAIGTGNGLTTTFPFSFGTLPTGDLVVTLIALDGTEDVQVENTDYTVLGEGSDDGGAIVFVTAPPTDYTVLIQRVIPILQPTDFKNQGSFYPRTHERAFDRSAMIDQQLFERVDAAMTLPPQVTGVSTTLPVPEPNTLFGWNSAGDGIDNFPLSDIATNIAYGDKEYQLFDGTGAQVNFTLSHNPGSLGNLDISIDGVTQVPGTDYTYSGTTLTFSTAPANGAVILVRFDLAVPVGTGLGSSIQFQQAGANAVIRSIQDKVREVSLALTDFADNPVNLIVGTEAIDTAWSRAQAALFLLNPEGGTIEFPAGDLRMTNANGLTVGNAPASNPSTLNGIKIKGKGWGRTATTMNANGAATRLIYDGTVGGTLLNLQGPISGVIIEDMMLDGNGKAATLISTQRSFHQHVNRVLGVNWTNGYALVINASSALGPTYGGAAPISHVYHQFDLQNPGVGACAVDIASGNGNVNQLKFDRCYLDRYNTTSTVGVRLGYCDHIQFAFCHIAQTGAAGSTGIAIQVKPVAGFGAFPWNITFTGTAMAGGVAYDSSAQAWTNATYPALIFQPFYTADGAPVPPKSANGGADLPAGLCRGVTDTGIEFGWWGEDQEVVAATPTIAPKKRVIILADDDAVAANNLIANITPPRAIAGVSLGGYELTIIPQITGTNPVKLVAGGNIAQDITLKNLQAVELVYSEGTGYWSVVHAGADGTYTPTCTNIANTSAITPRGFVWTRSGNYVDVYGRLEYTTAAAADTATTIEFTLPIAPAAFSNTWDAIGVGTVNEAVYRSALVIAQGSSARMQTQAASAAARACLINLRYRVN